MSTFTLYRFFDESGTLLYVGMTRDPERRMDQHRRQKPWWPKAERIEMQHFTTLRELRDAEKRAIREEHPVHNIQMNMVRSTGIKFARAKAPFYWHVIVSPPAIPFGTFVRFVNASTYDEAYQIAVRECLQMISRPVEVQR